MNFSTANSNISSGQPMYSVNSVTSFPTLIIAIYLSGSMEAFIGLVVGENLNDYNYFSWSQSIKIVFEGCHKFGYLPGEIPKPRP